MTQSTGGPGFTKRDLLAAARELTCQGQEPSVVDVLRLIDPNYEPAPPQTYANDLPFASATKIIELLAAGGWLRTEGEGPSLRILGPMPVDTDTHVLVANRRTDTGLFLQWRPKSSFPSGDDVRVEAEDVWIFAEEMPVAPRSHHSVSIFGEQAFMQHLYGKLSSGVRPS